MAAEEIAQKWVSANWMGWKQNRSMFEKVLVLRTRKIFVRSSQELISTLLTLGLLLVFQYDSEVPGTPGSGGEYVVQVSSISEYFVCIVFYT